MGGDMSAILSEPIVVPQELTDATLAAEARHREEMKGWTGGSGASFDAHEHLFEIRQVATKPYAS